MNIQGRGGDRAHEATTILVREGYRAAGDPSMYPEQIREGLRPWQPKKLYFSAGFGGPGGPGGRGGRGGPGAPAAEAPQTPPPTPQPATPPVKLTPVNTAAYDPLLGRTYAEIGTDARSNHKCQGMGGLPPLPGAGGGRGGRGGGGGYQLMESSLPGQVGKDETSLFDGIDTSLTALAQYAGPNPPQALVSGARRALSPRASGRKPPSRPATMPAPPPPSKRASPPCARCAPNCLRSASPIPRCTKSISASNSRSAIIRTPCWPPMA